MKQELLSLFSRNKPPATVPPGYVLLPVVPTLPMIRAGHEATRDGIVGVWAAMIQAAPSQSLK